MQKKYISVQNESNLSMCSVQNEKNLSLFSVPNESNFISAKQINMSKFCYKQLKGGIKKIRTCHFYAIVI